MNPEEQPARPAHAVDKQTEAKVLSVDFAEPISSKADPTRAFDVVLSLQDKEGESQTWRSEISSNYGTGNNANKTRAELTLSALALVGFKNPDISALEAELTGKLIPITVRWSYYPAKDTWYKNVYLGHGGLRKIEKAKALAIMRAISGVAEAPTAVAPQPQAFSTPPASPFAFGN